MEHEQQGDGPDLVAGEYVRTGLVGAGAAGPVHAALRVSDGLPVTLEALGGTDRRPERDTLLALRSPHLVPVLDVVEDEGTLLLVRRLREDADLAALLAAGGPLPELAALELLDQVLHGLEPVHVAEVVHGDLRPHHVLIDEHGMARVSGLGSAPDPARPLAPEVAAGQEPGPAADVHGAGVLLLTMLTGSAALGGLAGLPAGPVRDLAESLLAARPEQRPANAVLARAAVGRTREALAPRPVAAAVPSLPLPVAGAVPPAGRIPRLLAGAAALGVVAVAGVAVLLSGGSSAEPSRAAVDLTGASAPSAAPSAEPGAPSPAPAVTVNTGPDAAAGQTVAGPPPPVPGGPGTPGATVQLLPRSAAAVAPAAPRAVPPASTQAPPTTDPAPPPTTDAAPPPTTDPAPPPTTDPAPPPTTDPAPPPTTDPAPPPTTDPAPPPTTDPAPPPTTDPAPPPTTDPAPPPTTAPPTLDPPPATLPVTTPPVP